MALEWLLAPEVLITAGGAAASTLTIWWQARRAKKKRLKEEEKDSTEEETRDAEETAKREWKLAAEDGKDAAYQMEERKLGPEDIAEEVMQHIRFSRRRVYVGDKKTGERIIGISKDEVPYVTGDMVIRPARGLRDMRRLLPSERAREPSEQLMRVITKRALVQAYRDTTVHKQAIYSPDFRISQAAVYLLLDVSHSMFPRRGLPWRDPIWRAVVIGVLRRAITEEAGFVLRCFSRHVGDRFDASTEDQQRLIEQMVKHLAGKNGTDIPGAIWTAIEDLKSADYDEKELLIVTDGKVNNRHFAGYQGLREALDVAGIRLHAILLGTENDEIRKIADVFQIVDVVDERLRISRPVFRKET